ncbi:MAG: hypothetical protein RL186_1271 [Pseudomonadota bacterium]|jgi:SlyX protein
MDHRLESAEIHITHLTQAVEDLSDQLAKQGREMDALKARVDALVQYLAQARDEGRDTDIAPDQRPPHY